MSCKTATLHDKSFSETYDEMLPIIWNQIHEFKRRFRDTPANAITHEELLSSANETFVDTYYNYDHTRGPFFKRLSFQIWYNFLKEHVIKVNRRTVRENGCVNYVDMSEDPFPTNQQRFNLLEFIDELTEDAKVVVRLILDTPEDLIIAMRNDTPRPGRQSTRANLKQYLHGMNWDGRRIRETFSEITTTLSTFS